ncbi:CHAT domain-containing protein [Streptomyces sp. NPDC026672]|uniref:CHAT domain-containing protein n=1 Tax=unclassified Streptomyces TaxID=2593676 RepID=UPI0033C6BB29
MTTGTTGALRPSEADRPAERERLLAAVRAGLDRLDEPGGTARLHTAEARGDTDGLLWHLVGPAPGGGFAVDLEVAYVLGVMCLFRADDRPEAPTALTDGRIGLVLLAPFYCRLPGQPDVLPPPLRAALDQLLGEDENGDGGGGGDTRQDTQRDTAQATRQDTHQDVRRDTQQNAPEEDPAGSGSGHGRGGGARSPDPEAAVREHAAALADLALLVLELAVALPYPEAFGVCERLTGEALPYLAEPERSVAGCNLGYALLLGSVHSPEGRGRLGEAVAVLRTAFAGTPEDHPNHARCANGLGLALLSAAAEAEDRDRLPEAAAMLRTAVRTATEIDENVAQMHSDLGHTLTVYARSAGEGDVVGPEVREEAVAELRRAVDLTPDDDPALRERLDRLADALLTGLPEDDRPRAAAGAREAVEPLRTLLDLTPEGHPERPDVLLRLASAHLTAQEPEEVTRLLGEADPVFAGDAERTRQAGGLLVQAATLRGELASRSDLTDEQRADWEAVDAYMRPLLSGEAGGHPLGAVLNLLGMGAEGGGSRGQELMEFGNLVLGYPDRVSLGEVFGKALELQSRRISRLPEEERADALAAFLDGEPEASVPAEPVDTAPLDELLVLHERLLARLEPGSREHLLLRGGLSALRLQQIMYDSQNQPDDESRLRSMRGSLPLLRELFEELPSYMEGLGITPELFGGHTALAYSAESPFDQLEAVERGVREARRRLSTSEPGTPEHDATRASLAISLFIRHGVWSEEADFEEAVAIARELTAVPDPGMRAAMVLTQWTQTTGSRLQRARLLGAAAARPGQSSSLITRLASDGAARALDEHDPVEALETLEDGRAHLLSTALNARRELEVLHGADAELHARLRTALEHIRELRAGMERGRWPEPHEVEAQRLASEDAARLVAELQQRPGFRRFLTPLPLGLDDLRPAAAEGPVVSVNVHPRRCDALVLGPEGLRAVPLPRLYASDLAAQAESFRFAVEVLAAGPGDPLFEEAREIFTGTLAWLWDVLAEPVLDALGFTGPPDGGAPWPRLWWSPSGVLNAFPLHAAGRHGPGAPAGAAVLDRVASSYTPTVRALLHSRARRRAAPGDRGTLAVALPETPGQAPLARTVAEVTAVAAAGGGTPLIGGAATREAVRSALPAASVVHFACHADSDPEDPAASRLLLADGDLHIRDIAELRLESAELAYLSACGTARANVTPALADEVIHLASVFQLAGYTQSVATLWEVPDAFAARAAAGFHRVLAPALADPAPLPAALALHRAVRELRAADPERPWTWGALVHAGS